MSDTLKHTPLYAAHVALGARMVPFAGYHMPLQYPLGLLEEHRWTRNHAGLFDVSHMGIIPIHAESFDAAARALETLVPADLLEMKPGQLRYTQILNAAGGIVDDAIVGRPPEPVTGQIMTIVVNASRKHIDFPLIQAALGSAGTANLADHTALIALQGPEAVDVLAGLVPEVRAMAFMTNSPARIGSMALDISRSGYTGGDGFEITVPANHAVALWEMLLENPAMRPIGLGARDSLRLEAGLCLYGHDLDETTSPVEASLVWSIGKRRRIEGGFPGFERIARELAGGPARRRVGLAPQTRSIAREGAPIFDDANTRIGTVTSGGFSPMLNGPVAMGYVAAQASAPDTSLILEVHGKPVPARVTRLPFLSLKSKKSGE